MALQLRIVDAGGNERIVDVQPGDTVDVAPGETVTLLNDGDATDIDLTRSGDDLGIETDGGTITLQGFFAASAAAPTALVLEDQNGLHVYTSDGGDEQQSSFVVPPSPALPLPEDIQFAEGPGGGAGYGLRSVFFAPGSPYSDDAFQPGGEADGADVVEIFAGLLGGPARFSVADVVGREGTEMVFVVTRTGNAFTELTLDFDIRPSGANPASAADVSATHGSVTFARGQLTAFIRIDLRDDGVPEPTETFTLRLQARGSDEVEFDRQEATGTILNNEPPVAGDDAVAVNEDATTGDLRATLLANDVDNDVDERLTITNVSGTRASINPTTGVVRYTASGFDSLAQGTTTTDTFTYTVADRAGRTDTATVTVTITGVNDAPVADDEAFAVAEDAAALVIADTTLLTGDTDVDTGETATLAVTAVSGTSTGGATISLGGGNVTYDHSGLFQNLSAGQTTVDTFTYTVQDVNGATDVGTVSVTVTGVNDPITAVADAVAATEDGGVFTFTGASLIANDTDPDSLDVKTITAVSGPNSTLGVPIALVGGNVTYNVTGLLQNLAAGATTTDTFTYTVSDGQGSTDTATVTVTITGVNDAPVAVNDAAAATEDGAAVVITGATLAGNDTDVDDGETATLTVSAVSGTSAAGATVTLGGGSVTYDHAGLFQDLAQGATTTDTFTYTVQDVNGGTDTATVTVTVTGVNDAPVAFADAAAATEDGGAVVITGASLIGNDTDVDTGAVLTVTALSGATSTRGASITLTGGDVTYDPGALFQNLAQGATTTDTFTYTVSDGLGGTDTATVTVTVTGVNDAPVAVADAAAATEDGGAVVITGASLTGNDTDADDGAALSVTALSGATSAGGAALTLTGGNVTYNPGALFQNLAQGATTTDTFTYTVSDGLGGTDTATVTVTVTGVNDAPVAVADAAAATEDGGAVVITGASLTGNDTDVDDGAALTVAAISGATSTKGASITLTGGDVTYDPGALFQNLAQGATTTDTFTYTVSDGLGGTDTATVTVTVTGVNDAPVAADDAVTVSNLFTVNLNVAANDSDVDVGDVRTITHVNGIAIATGGNVTLASSGVVVTLTPTGRLAYDATTGNATITGLTGTNTATDSFTYTISDGNGGTDTATVNVTITTNQAPVAGNDTAAATEDGAAVVIANAALLANDTDPDPGETATLTVSAVSGTSAGGATVTLAGGNVTYDHSGLFQNLSAGATTVDTFTYTVQDVIGSTDTGTVSVTVTGVNDPVTAVADVGAATEDGGAVVITGATLTGNDIDVDAGDTLTVTALSGATSTRGASITLTAGDVTYNPGALFQNLAQGATTTDTFTYTVSDGQGSTDTATVTVTVTGVNDAPVADNETAAATEDGAAVVIANATLLTGDTDVDDGASLSVSAVSGTSAGGATVTLGGGNVTYDHSGLFQNLAQGATTTDTFTYTVNDGLGGTDTGTVTVTVTGVNDAPVAVADAAAATEDGGAVVITGASLIGNDTDVDTGAVLTVTALSGATSTRGASITLTAGDVTYNPGALFQNLAQGATTTDTFTYTVSDGLGGTDTATVTVTITGVNDAPVADNETAAATEDGAAVVIANATLLTGDTDVDDGASLSVSAVSGTSAGGATVTLGGGNVTYDHAGLFQNLAQGATTTDTFTYTVSDGLGGTDTATVTVTVTGVNDAPVADNETAAATEDGPAVVIANATLLTGDTDVDDGATLSVSAVSGTSAGGATVTLAGGNVTYDHSGLFQNLAQGATTTDTFTYTVNDGLGGTDTATVTVTITGVNDAPVADNETAAATEDGPAVVIANATLLAGDTDVDDGASLSVSAVSGTSAGGATVTLGGGNVTYDHSGLFQNLAQGATTTDTFTYTVNDGLGGTDTGTVTVTVTGVNDAPVAFADAAAATEDGGAVVITGASLIGNDTDVDTGAALTVTALSGATSTRGASITLTGGDVTYDPGALFQNLAQGATTTDTFTYTVSDGLGGTDTATVTVTITGVNDAPVADNETAAATEDGPAVVIANATLLAGDTDVDDGASLSVSAVSGTSAGGATVTLGGGNVTYNHAGLFQNLAQGATTTDTFTYTVNDGLGGTDTATVTVTVTGVNDAPVAIADAAAATEDGGAVVITGASLTGNDTDVDDGAALTVAAISGATSTKGASITLTGGDVTYDPGALFQNLAQGATTTDTFTYTVSDGLGGTDTATVTVTITGVNDAPVAADDAVTVSNLFTVNLNVAANDSDVDVGDVRTITHVNGIAIATGGNVTLASSGVVVTLTPTGRLAYDATTGNATITGLTGTNTATDSFTYTISDGNGGTDTATVNVTITTNQAPVAGNDTAAATEDGAAVVIANAALLANDTDPDPGETATLTVSAVSGTSAGGATVTLAGGNVTYDHSGLFQNLSAGATTVDTFTYTVQDVIGSTDTGTVSVTVTGVNDPVTAVADVGAATEDGGAVVITGATLTGNDIDVDAGDTLTVTALSGATSTRGASITLTAGDVTYNPGALFQNLAQGATTTDTFTYTVSDGQGSTDTATVTVTVTGVNDAPVADNETAAATEDGPAVVIANATLLAGDTDVDDGATLSVSAVSGTSAGGATVTLGGGNVTYDHSGLFQNLAQGATTTDTFTYTVNDGLGGTDTGTVTVTVTGVNDAPVAVADAAAATEDGGAVVITGASLIGNDTDADDGAALTVVAISGATSTKGASITLTGGNVTYNPGALFQNLAQGATTTDTFTYTVSDGLGGTDTATVTVTITGVNDAPVADNETAAATEDGAAVVIANATLLTGDTDVDDGATLSVSAVSGTSAGGATVTLGGGNVTYDHSGLFQNLAQGATTTDTFTYTVNDGLGGTDTATVTVTVTGVNDAPVADNETAAATEDGPAVVIANATLLTGDTDVDDGATLSVSAVSGTSAGGATVTLAGGNVTYDHSGLFQNLAQGATTTDTFTYTVSDGLGGTDTATVTVTITGVNDAPVADNETAAATEDGPAVVIANATLLTGDTDVDDGATLSVSAVSGTSAGGATVTLGGGNVTYNHAGLFQNLSAGQTTVDTFTYTANDGLGGTDAGTVSVTVTGTNDPVVAVDDSAAATEDGAAVVIAGASLVGNDTDVDAGDTLSVLSVAGPSAGGATVTFSGGNVTYDHSGLFQNLSVGDTAVDTFTYTVTDGAGATDTATVTVTITGTNDPVVAVADAAAATEDGPAVVIAGASLVSNDTDVDANDTLVVLSVGATSAGGATVSLAGGNVTYDHSGLFQNLAQGATTTDTFTYTVSDGRGATDTATVTVTITGVNDAPVAVADAAAATEDGGAVVITGASLTGNDTDVDDGAALTVAAISGATSTKGASITLTGVDVTYDPGALFQNLALNATTTDTFTYTVSDGLGGTDTATVTVTVTGVNDAPVAVADAFDVSNQAPRDIDVAANDSDVDVGDVRTITQVNGLAIATGGNVTLASSGVVVTLQPSGQLSYDATTGNATITGLTGTNTATDSFTYTISDGHGGTDTATVTITISANTPPVAGNDTAAATEDGAVVVIADTTLLTNDTDADVGDTLSVTGVSATSAGGASVTFASGNVTYDHTGLFQNLADSATTTDTFTYTVSDGNGGTDAGTVTVTVTGVNDVPIFGGDATGNVTEDAGGTLTTSGTLTISDADDGEGAFITGAASGGTVGTLTVDSAAGAWSYSASNASATVQALAEGATLNDVFTIATDDFASTTTTVTVTITGVNDAPVNSVPVAAQTAFTSTNKVFNATNGNLISISDVDIGGSNMSVTLTASTGTLTLATVAGLSFASGANGSGAMTFSGTLSAVNTALDGLTYNTTSSGNQTITVVANDGATLNNTDTDVINVTVTDPPISVIDTDTLDGTQGLKLNGVFGDASGTFADRLGSAVSGVGDLNGDGRPDLVVASPQYELPGDGAVSINRGAVYVLFGNTTANLDTLANGTTGFDIDLLNGTQGIRILGRAAGAETGDVLAGGGDFNGDGLSDLMIGEFSSTTQNAYTVYGDDNAVGAAANFSGLHNLSVNSLSGTVDVNGDGLDDGAQFTGLISRSNSGFLLSGIGVGNAGDVDNDGIDDLLFGGSGLDANGVDSGNSFLVFGGTRASLDSVGALAHNGTTELAFRGGAAGEWMGRTVSGIGDINHDGFDDFAIGASSPSVSLSGGDGDGEVYVVFGNTRTNLQTLSSSINSGSIGSILNGTNGFTIDVVPVEASGDAQLGADIAGIGDFNGDGIDDFAVMAAGRGLGFLIFGKTTAFGSVINLNTDIAATTSDGSQGIAFIGPVITVDGAGDVNGDGLNDIILGNPNSGADAYVIFGTTDPAGLLSAVPYSGFTGRQFVDLTGGTTASIGGGVALQTGGSLFGKGVIIDGGSTSLTGQSVAGIGDFNGDGFDDMLVGAPQALSPTADTVNTQAGQAYVVYGADYSNAGATAVNLTATGAAQTLHGTLAGGDVLSSGGFANTRMSAGAGNDVLRVNGTEFQVNGGGGTDVLTPDANGITLDFDALTDKNRYQNIEQIQLNGFGTNTLRVDVRDVINMTGPLKELLVTGDAGVDTVVASDGWTSAGTDSRTIDLAGGGSESVTFTVYTLSGSTARLLVESDINHTIS